MAAENPSGETFWFNSGEAPYPGLTFLDDTLAAQVSRAKDQDGLTFFLADFTILK
jgi:hypothetical protein